MFKRIRQFFGSVVNGMPNYGNAAARGFSGARIDSYSKGWAAYEQDFNDTIAQDLDILRTRCRDLIMNSDYAVRYKNLLETNVIGPAGIKLQSRAVNSRGVYDARLSSFIEEKFEDWKQNYADVRGIQHFNDFCKTLMGSMPSDGEFLVYKVRNWNDNPYGLSLQHIDVDNIDTAKSFPEKTDHVVTGVRVNSYMKPIAIYLKGNTSDNYEAEVLSMDNVFHCYKILRANQVRGIPWMASSILGLRYLSGYMFAALVAAQRGADHYGFFTSPVELFGNNLGDSKFEPSQPGYYDVLPSGVQFSQIDSKYPTDSFSAFVKCILQRIASSWGISYSSLTGDLESVNYSSIRSGVLQEREEWINNQKWFIDTFLDPLYKEWLESAYLNGIFDKALRSSSMPEEIALSRLMPHEWQPRRWDWVDPKNDAEAKISLVKAGILPPEALSSSMGYDYEDNLQRIAVNKKLAEKLGLSLNIFEKDSKMRTTDGQNDEQDRERQQKGDES